MVEIEIDTIVAFSVGFILGVVLCYLFGCFLERLAQESLEKAKEDLKKESGGGKES